MRIFVAGGAGYVGSHCVRRLVEAGHTVTVFDNLCAGHREAVPDGVELIVGDLAEYEKLREILQPGRFDAVMHFAAFLNVGESVHKPLMYYRNNVSNTIKLLIATHAANIKCFVFSSTCAVYGVPQRLPITEDLPKDPINPYGTTKWTVECMLRDCSAAWGLGSMSLRYFNASGAASDGSIGEDHDPEIHLIPLILQVALGQRENIKVFGADYPTPDGSCVRDYIHVEDLAEAHLRAVEQVEDGRAEAYNVGTGQGNSVLEVIEAARRVTGRQIPAVMSERRAGDPPELYANPNAIRERLGWAAKWTDIEQTIASAWRWHERHPRGFGGG